MVTLNKKMRQLKEQMNQKTAQAKAFLADGEGKDVEKATALLGEVDELQKEYSAEEKLFKLEQTAAEEKSEKQFENKKEANSVEKFADTIRGMVRKDGTVTPMTEGVNASGGYTVPEDIRTEIEHFKENDFSFESYISKENVATNKGRRTYESKTNVTPFVEFAEVEEVPESDKPTYIPVNYEITDKGGFIPLTKDLINDSSTNDIEKTIIKYAKVDPRIVYLKNDKNLKLSKTLNK